LSGVREKQNEMLTLLETLELKVLEDFSLIAPTEAEIHLLKPVLVRCPDGLLALNFDPTVNFLGAFPL